MTSRRIQALVLATAAVAGYAGAAAFTATAAPALAEATDFGSGDGLTRLVLTADSGAFDPTTLEALESVDGVVHAQALDGGQALVATDGLSPQHLEAVPGVAAAEVSVTVPVLGTADDPYYTSYGWNLENTGSNAYQQTATADADMDAADGWASGTGSGLVVAVTDTGFDTDHPDLQGALWNNPDPLCASSDGNPATPDGDCHGWNFYSNSPDLDNAGMGSHGTGVSGVIAARAGNGTGSAGVAPDITIMPLVIGGGDTVHATLAAQAIRYAVDNGADVINASWGGAFTGAPLQALKDAVAYAAAHDVLVVAASGNDALNRDTSILYPASLPDANIVTVGSSTALDTMSASSAYGATSVDLFAPGNKVATTWNDGGYRLISGTSIAAPHVAAAYALYRAQLPDAGFAELKQALFADVDPLPAFAGKSVTGGRLTMSHLTATPVESVAYGFTSMTAPAGVVTPAIGVTGPTTAGDYDVVLGLGMEDAGEIWALADKDVTVDGVTVPTDDTGTVTFPLGSPPGLDGEVLAPSMELGDGRYVLTVQTLRDGVPVGRTYAAPLLVGTAVPVPTPPSTTTPGSTTPGTTTPGTTTPGTTTPGTTTPGTQPGPTTPGTTTPVTTPPGTTPPVSGPGTTPGTTPGSTTPGTTTPGTTTPGTTTPGSTTPGTTTPGTTTPGTTTPGTTPPATAPPGTMPSGGTTPDPGTPVPGTTTYPSLGVFKVTSLSPNVVDVAGGTVVTITGQALPANPTVRIGGTATGTVVTSTTTRVTFRVPARVAGRYDVSVFAPDGRTTVLSNALTYAAGIGTAPDGGSGTSPAPGGTTPGGTTPGGSTPGTSTPGTTTPGGTTPGGTSPGGSTPGSTTPGAVVRSGPAGERLVRSATFDRLRSIWSVNCSSSCTGAAI